MTYEMIWISGWMTAKNEIERGCASFANARERGMSSMSQDQRVDWEAGYEAACAMYRLGYDLQILQELEAYEGTMTMAAVATGLLDHSWSRTIRAEPRK
jgi:hypothetical protein